MIVNRLVQDELAYESQVRGIGVGTVEEMRHRLSMAIQMEKSGDSLKYPSYPFTVQQDLDAVADKLIELEPKVADFNNSNTSGAFQKYQSKLSHVLGRIDNIPSGENVISDTKRSELLAKALTLLDLLISKAEQYSKNLQGVPPQLSILDPGESTFQSGVVSHRRSSGLVATAAGVSSVPPNSRSTLKSILPSKWDLKFSGERKGISLSAFLERVEELRVARNVSKGILLESGIDLFTGRAYQFYLAYRHEVDTWDDFVLLLREEFLSADYNEKLFEEIRRRTQGPDESIGIYLAVMSGYFKRLTCPMSEDAKLKILLRNIAPCDQSQLRSANITSISELLALGRRLEIRKVSIENFGSHPEK
ncbi:hypothetical protein JTB14_031866 [Gonioctena quinquepunctata]|nr:hypothetical protein JTB14_031866 [Gonioctena quinquepunctata]